jgi:hypothetical protein
LHQQFGKHLVGFRVLDDRAHRHAQHDVGGRGAVLVGAAAALTVARLVPACVAEVDQRVQVAVAHGKDTATAAAVATVRATEGNELFAAKAHAAIAAIAGHHVDGGFVNEFHAGTRLSMGRAEDGSSAEVKKRSPGTPGLRCDPGRLGGPDFQAPVTVTVWRFSGPLTA